MLPMGSPVIARVTAEWELTDVKSGATVWTHHYGHDEPVLDDDDITIGYVRHVVRTPEGKIQLIVNHGKFFGWGGRLVPVPIELVAILARQIAALDMPREDFAASPTWSEASTRSLPADETIRIAITRR